jgi:SAM-dependent methyltransferase
MQNIPNVEMAAAWNGVAGQAWVDEQQLLDRTFEPIQELLAEAAAARGASAVLDIGCGSGATTLAVARRLGARGHATGVDISAPLVAVAQARARREGVNAQFIRADAQTHDFEPASFDLMISRFGVMFFDDPVAAFANLRRAAMPACSLQLVVFRSIAENPFMTTAERAAAPLLTNLPPRKPDAPGQFAFADRERVRGILAGAGWSQAGLTPIDIDCGFPVADLERYFTRFGPLGQVLREADDATRQRVIEAVRAAFQRFVRDGEVRFTAACWLVSARAA